MRKVIGVLLIIAGIIGVVFMFNPAVADKSGEWLSQAGDSLLNTATKEIHIEKSVAAAGIKNVAVETGSVDVQLVPGSGDDIVARVHGRVSNNDAESIDLKATSQGDKLQLSVQLPDGVNFGVHIFDVKLTVELPEQQWNALQVAAGSANVEAENLNSALMEVASGSGNIRLNGIEARTAAMQAGSGDIATGNIHAESFTVQTKSGNIRVQDIESVEMEAIALSGNLQVERYESSMLNFRTGSGNARLSDGHAKLNGESGSGNITIETDELRYDAELKASSGNVTVNLSQEPADLAVDFSGGSGSARIRWDGMRYEEQNKDDHTVRGAFGNGGTMLKVRTRSGEFTLGK
ncbi:DUF4097 domain-containing protein [Paenibacillus dendritiformis]|uniref:DUF4097 family beta strand repeat-containing protein n=1 Tax=Paenibacillus dendritiformis TaxID=130049 RepID=UPI00143D5D48|nr:DUF4097 family beta strand repeat-containing protein [Paenibacillus dendritiformis]NKI23527.1 DUF4097 domain-containing protein [Paenibacillus dendritiformis]NRG00468.1 DUF4097 family beta strand repeat protein [Paenibacillus dendritiformis]